MQKNQIGFVLGGSLILLACAPLDRAPAQPAGVSQNRAKMSGWIDFSSAGFRLYAVRENFGNLYDGTCIAGAFPAKLQRQVSKKLHGKKVEVTGILTSEPELDFDVGTQIIRSFKGTRFENACANSSILFGEKINKIP